MKYIVIEIQNNDGQISHLFDSFDNERQAISKYHTVIAAAAVSGLTLHTGMLCDETGNVYEIRCFRHEEEPTK